MVDGGHGGGHGAKMVHYALLLLPKRFILIIRKMATINQSSGQGALFELVARGVKDNYFVKDSKESTFPFDARYDSSISHLAERRTTVPITQTRFGQTFEVEIDAYGDILTECALEIDLPSWFPSLPSETSTSPLVSPEKVNRLFPITTNDPANTSYGYVNAIGYFLFEHIQLYQDQILLQEWSGDGLLAKEMTEGSWNSSFLAQKLGGVLHSNGQMTANRAIQIRATPGHLRIVLPLPGMQSPGDMGLPLCAMPWQHLRIKGTLRKLEDLIVCSDSTVYKPAPWNVPTFKVTYDNGSTYTFAPLQRTQLSDPVILLSTVQQYVPPSVQEEIRGKTLEIPFRRIFENKFSFGELDFISLDKGGVSAVTRALDGRHPTERIFWFFRNQNQLDNNRLDSFYNDYFDSRSPSAAQPYTEPYGEFYYRLKMNIAGKEREDLHEPSVWSQLNQLAKDEKANGMHIGSMNWSTGEKYGVIYPAPKQPEGVVNLTTADHPTLYIELANITSNIILGQRKAEMRVFTEGWNVYVVKEGRGRMMFAS